MAKTLKEVVDVTPVETPIENSVEEKVEGKKDFKIQVIEGTIRCDGLWTAKKLTFGQLFKWLQSIQIGSKSEFEIVDQDVLDDIQSVQELAVSMNGQIQFDTLLSELQTRIQADKFSGKTEVQNTIATLRLKDLPYNAK